MTVKLTAALALALLGCSSRGAISFDDPDAARADAAVVDTPLVDAPPVDAPSVDVPSVDVPSVDAPPPVDAPPVDVPAPPLDRPPPADVPSLLDRPPPVDVPPPPVDVPPPPVDVPPPVDRPAPVDVPPPVDSGTASGRGQYLDPCGSSAECASGDCLATAAGARWCTRACTSSAQCGHGSLCGGGRCVPDDTGAACTPSASACARRCLANAAGLAGHCTRECAVGADCPAGFACAAADGGGRFCVSIEHGCEGTSGCTSGLCLSTGAGYALCTSACATDADCPRRLTVDDGAGHPAPLPPYRCTAVAGQMLCVPPLANLNTGNGLVRGNHALGEDCALSGETNLCASGACDSGDRTCVQACTPATGCPAGFTCLPWQPGGAGTPQYLVCRAGGNGRGAAGAACGRASDCASGACLPLSAGTPYCTRYCADGLCPTGMRCVAHASAFDGTALSTCER